ncbi:hypothetical protein O181_129863 [Austropuccinia psidii MF-1]|uniref:Uncharacterized protein n=1 Tax=Austropuccinia psidii MF-1 TaxID=1389203 RepID=A0A9Q3Q981_9BASI|nr:hypothetical protein [Austropuccinia psidii MF-1]
MEVDSSENSEDSEGSLSKSIGSSDSLPSETELNKSKVTLRRSRRLAIGRKTSQRKSHKPATSLKIYDAIDLNCEHCQRNYHTSDVRFVYETDDNITINQKYYDCSYEI